MLRNGNFWIGLIAGVALFYLYGMYKARKASAS